MDRVRFWVGSRVGATEERRADHETGALRNKLISLALDWELAASTLDAQRYRTEAGTDPESLKDSALVYRKCIAELTDILAGAAVLKRNKLIR